MTNQHLEKEIADLKLKLRAVEAVAAAKVILPYAGIVQIKADDAVMIEQIAKYVKTLGLKDTLFLIGDDFDLLDEKNMRTHGWVRAER